MPEQTLDCRTKSRYIPGLHTLIVFAPNARVRVLPAALDVEVLAFGAWTPVYRTVSTLSVWSFVSAHLSTGRAPRLGAVAIASPVDWDALADLCLGGLPPQQR